VLSLYNLAHARQARAKVFAAGVCDADPADAAIVRCRYRNALVPQRLAGSLEGVLARTGRQRDGGNAWACRACIAAARDE